MKIQLRKIIGFTLVEMLLVMVVVSAIIVMGVRYVEQRAITMRIDRTSAQMQQILNAGLSYYVSNGSWPGAMTDLIPAYLPSSSQNTPWGTTYQINSTALGFFVAAPMPKMASAPSTALIIAGSLPLAFTDVTFSTTSPAANACGTTGNCYVISMVNIPGSSLNTAGSVNFAGLYHNGACVPVPNCPKDPVTNVGMAPQIMVVPVSVNGYAKTPTGTPCNPTDLSGCTINSYPLNGFSAYASAQDTQPASCDGNTAHASCSMTVQADGTPIPIGDGKQYWRVCLSVATEAGNVNPNDTDSGSSVTTNAWGQLVGVVMAITRCVPSQEFPGSDFTVWAP